MQYPVSSVETGMDSENRPIFRSLDDVLPDVKYLLPRCDSEITMRKQLAEAAQRFCRETGCFQTTLSIPVVSKQARYSIPVDTANADLLTVIRVSVFQTGADGVESYSRDIYPNGYWIEEPTEEDGAYINLLSAMTVSPGQVVTLKLLVSLLPLFDQELGTQAYALPDKFIRRWRQAFIAGAVMSLANMDGKAWSNKSLAADMRERWFANVAEAHNKANFNRMNQGSASCVNPVGFV